MVEKIKNLIFDEDEPELETKIIKSITGLINYLNLDYINKGFLSYEHFNLIDNILEFLFEEMKTNFLSKNSNISMEIIKVHNVYI